MSTVPAHHTLCFQSLKDLYSDLLRLGVVPTACIPSKKSAFDPTNVQVTLFDADRNSIFSSFEQVQQGTGVRFMTTVKKPQPVPVIITQSKKQPTKEEKKGPIQALEEPPV